MTLNNWEAADWESVKMFIETECTVGAMGREVGEGGTPHLQIAFRMKKPCRMAHLKEMWPRGHFETMKARGDEAFTYCRKDDPAAFWHDTRAPGKRNDLVALYDSLKAGKNIFDILEDYPTMQHIKIAECWMKYKQPKRPHAEREILWFWGPTGTGKTRRAYEIDPDLLSVTCTGSHDRVWFDGYMGQRTILLDDLRPDVLKFAKLLKLLDRYTQQEQTKGGHVWANYDRVIVTAPYPPSEWTTDGGDIEQLLRRITRIEHFAVGGGGGRVEGAPAHANPGDVDA